MILLISGKLSGSSDMLMRVFSERAVPAFRFNLDMFDRYRFLWENDNFTITDPEGRCCKSSDIEAMAFYKGILMADQSLDNYSAYAAEMKWVVSWLNKLYDCLICYGADHGLLRLWHPHGFGYAKTLQMERARKYFPVPDFRLHWGSTLDSRQVIAKPLTQRPLSNGEMAYAKIVDQADLDPQWPWFTQQIAEGNRDATVLYVNGKIHCYKFASPRGSMTDWRITQGTNDNQWLDWEAGVDFKRRIDSYMNDMKLKYGRLDFIIGGDEPQFLEVNPAGQFGWLDSENGFPLHNEVADALLDPSSDIMP